MIFKFVNDIKWFITLMLILTSHHILTFSFVYFTSKTNLFTGLKENICIIFYDTYILFQQTKNT